MLTESRLNESQVMKEVKQIMADNMGIPVAQIEADHTLDSDLGCDSLDLVEITMEVEEHFDISIPDSQSESARTVADITAGVMQLIGHTEPI